MYHDTIVHAPCPFHTAVLYSWPSNLVNSTMGYHNVRAQRAAAAVVLTTKNFQAAALVLPLGLQRQYADGTLAYFRRLLVAGTRTRNDGQMFK